MNVLTNSMERLTKVLSRVDEKFKKMGTEPYGIRKATAKEQRDFYENLTEAQVYELIEKHGVDKVNAWLYKMEQGGKHG